MESIHLVRAEDLPLAQLRRRQRILDAAKDLLLSEGYDRVQIREIAALAGVALGTVYRYFSSKEHVYATVLQVWTDPFFDSPADRMIGVSALDRARFRLRRVIAAFVRNPNFVMVRMMLSMSTDPNVVTIREELGQAVNARLIEDLRVLPGKQAEDVTAIAWCITTQLVTNVSTSLISLEEAFRLLDEYFLLVERSSATAI